jgi:hypothetical protein
MPLSRTPLSGKPNAVPPGWNAGDTAINPEGAVGKSDSDGFPQALTAEAATASASHTMLRLPVFMPARGARFVPALSD